MKEKIEPRCVIQKNADRLKTLHSRVHETLKFRDANPEAHAEWSRACDEFQKQYDALAFPGGYASGLQKLQAGETSAIEDALAFLEVRPYFFRSQYIRTKLTRCDAATRAPLAPLGTDHAKCLLATWLTALTPIKTGLRIVF